MSRGSRLAIDGQTSWAAGMFRLRDRRRIPSNGAYDLENAIIDDAGAIPRRGGSEYVSDAAFGAGLTFLWDGELDKGHRTVVASPTAFGVMNTLGAVTSVGGAGLQRPVPPVVYKGLLYFPGGVTFDGDTLGVATKAADHYATAGGRLIACVGNRAYMSGIDAITFDETDYHELPHGANIIGAAGARDRLALFTTAGVWLVSNVALDLTDDTGSAQQSLDLFSRDLILWDPAGLAGWEGGLVVPALDGVWLLGIGVDQATAPPPFQKISASIEQLYSRHVARGRRAGGAIVHRGHLLLPIVTNTRSVDVLVCRLDQPARVGLSTVLPWTRFSGHAAQISMFAARAQDGQYALLGAQRDVTARVSRMRYFDTDQTMKDADGSTALWQVVTRDFTDRAPLKRLVKRVRASYVLADAAADNPVLEAAYAVEEPASAPGTPVWGGSTWGGTVWASADEAWTELAGDAPEDPTGAVPYEWPLAVRAERIRFRLRSALPSARASILTFEVFSRPTGKL